MSSLGTLSVQDSSLDDVELLRRCERRTLTFPAHGLELSLLSWDSASSTFSSDVLPTSVSSEVSEGDTLEAEPGPRWGLTPKLDGSELGVLGNTSLNRNPYEESRRWVGQARSACCKQNNRGLGFNAWPDDRLQKLNTVQAFAGRLHRSCRWASPEGKTANRIHAHQQKIKTRLESGESSSGSPVIDNLILDQPPDIRCLDPARRKSQLKCHSVDIQNQAIKMASCDKFRLGGAAACRPVPSVAQCSKEPLEPGSEFYLNKLDQALQKLTNAKEDKQPRRTASRIKRTGIQRTALPTALSKNKRIITPGRRSCNCKSKHSASALNIQSLVTEVKRVAEVNKSMSAGRSKTTPKVKSSLTASCSRFAIKNRVPIGSLKSQKQQMVRKSASTCKGAPVKNVTSITQTRTDCLHSDSRKRSKSLTERVDCRSHDALTKKICERDSPMSNSTKTKKTAFGPNGVVGLDRKILNAIKSLPRDVSAFLMSILEGRNFEKANFQSGDGHDKAGLRGGSLRTSADGRSKKSQGGSSSLMASAHGDDSLRTDEEACGEYSPGSSVMSHRFKHGSRGQRGDGGSLISRDRRGTRSYGGENTLRTANVDAETSRNKKNCAVLDCSISNSTSPASLVTEILGSIAVANGASNQDTSKPNPTLDVDIPQFDSCADLTESSDNSQLVCNTSTNYGELKEKRVDKDAADSQRIERDHDSVKAGYNEGNVSDSSSRTFIFSSDTTHDGEYKNQDSKLKKSALVTPFTSKDHQEDLLKHTRDKGDVSRSSQKGHVETLCVDSHQKSIVSTSCLEKQKETMPGAAAQKHRLSPTTARRVEWNLPNQELDNKGSVTTKTTAAVATEQICVNESVYSRKYDLATVKLDQTQPHVLGRNTFNDQETAGNLNSDFSGRCAQINASRCGTVPLELDTLAGSSNSVLLPCPHTQPRSGAMSHRPGTLQRTLSEEDRHAELDRKIIELTSELRKTCQAARTKNCMVLLDKPIETNFEQSTRSLSIYQNSTQECVDAHACYGPSSNKNIGDTTTDLDALSCSVDTVFTNTSFTNRLREIDEKYRDLPQKEFTNSACSTSRFAYQNCLGWSMDETLAEGRVETKFLNTPRLSNLHEGGSFTPAGDSMHLSSNLHHHPAIDMPQSQSTFSVAAFRQERLEMQEIALTGVGENEAPTTPRRPWSLCPGRYSPDVFSSSKSQYNGTGRVDKSGSLNPESDTKQHGQIDCKHTEEDTSRLLGDLKEATTPTQKRENSNQTKPERQSSFSGSKIDLKQVKARSPQNNASSQPDRKENRDILRCIQNNEPGKTNPLNGPQTQVVGRLSSTSRRPESGQSQETSKLLTESRTCDQLSTMSSVSELTNRQNTEALLAEIYQKYQHDLLTAPKNNETSDLKKVLEALKNVTLLSPVTVNTPYPTIESIREHSAVQNTCTNQTESSVIDSKSKKAPSNVKEKINTLQNNVKKKRTVNASRKAIKIPPTVNDNSTSAASKSSLQNKELKTKISPSSAIRQSTDPSFKPETHEDITLDKEVPVVIDVTLSPPVADTQTASQRGQRDVSNNGEFVVKKYDPTSAMPTQVTVFKYERDNRQILNFFPGDTQKCTRPAPQKNLDRKTHKHAVGNKSRNSDSTHGRPQIQTQPCPAVRQTSFQLSQAEAARRKLASVVKTDWMNTAVNPELVNYSDTSLHSLPDDSSY